MLGNVFFDKRVPDILHPTKQDTCLPEASLIRG